MDQRVVDPFAPDYPVSPQAAGGSTGSLSPFGAGNASPELLAHLAGLSGYSGGASHVLDSQAQHNLNQLVQAVNALQQQGISLGQAGSPSIPSLNPYMQVLSSPTLHACPFLLDVGDVCWICGDVC